MFSVVPRAHTLTHRRLYQYIMKHFFPVRVTKHWYMFLRELLEVSSLEDTQKPPGHSPRQLAIGGLARTIGLDMMPSRCAFLPQPFSDSLTIARSV